MEIKRAEDHARSEQSQAARDERVRMIVAARELENVLSAASWHQKAFWKQRVRDALILLQTALKDSRELADAEGSLFSEVTRETPRLDSRVRCIREEYEDIERHVASLRSQLSQDSTAEERDVEDLRQRLRRLITSLQHVQAKETELLYEAFQVDIGHGE